jgi:hypothetical protein
MELIAAFSRRRLRHGSGYERVPDGGRVLPDGGLFFVG